MSDPATSDPVDYAHRVREELRVRCVSLRTKAAYFPLPRPGDHENEAPTACWWCLRTGEALGPDGSTARPVDCDAPGRVCYQPPVRV
jgi:hypothetical protein